MKKLLYTLLLAAMAFGSCSKEETPCYDYYTKQGAWVGESCGLTPAQADQYAKQREWVAVPRR